MAPGTIKDAKKHRGEHLLNLEEFLLGGGQVTLCIYCLPGPPLANRVQLQVGSRRYGDEARRRSFSSPEYNGPSQQPR